MTKSANVLKWIGTGVLAASVALTPLALPADAQTDPSPSNPTLDTTPFAESDTDSNNWGWLGLIGLIGLANLFRKPKTVERYRDPEVSTARRDEF
jgi:hypothetical protein